MAFAIGNVNVAIHGQHATARMLREILEPATVGGGRVDLEVRFATRLPAGAMQRFTALGKYKVAPDRVGMERTCWCYEISSDGDALVLNVAPTRKPMLRTIATSIRKSWKYFHTHGRGASLRATKRCVYNVFLPVLELVLLSKESTLAHCSAISADGKAVIFASLGGIGKTSLMSNMVEQGWGFLSDDLCVIGADGTVSLLPLPMHIYAYHEEHAQELVRKMRCQLNSFDKMLWLVCSHIKRPDKLVRWIGPDRVFGANRLTRSAKVAVVIHMRRCHGADGFAHRQADPGQVARLMANTVLVELDALPDMVTSTCSCETVSFIPDISTIHSNICRVYKSAFSDAAIHMIDIPQQVTPNDVLGFLREKKLLQPSHVAGAV